MAKRGKTHDQDPDRVHREILDYLDEHPPPSEKTPSTPPAARPKKPAPRSKKPVPRPELMLRRLRYDDALGRLETFLRFHFEAGTPEVRVVHGKGLRSGDEGPVLRDAVRDYCDRHPRWVRSYREAPPKEGGQGALIIRLRSP